ncbi:MAG: 16S rRNA (guanine(527)-N(7))-methyltransferase RsmG [Clostridia bacterium]|nr:16S rRNA (guanine(527)-N(7))-methyltransferase RsmG [Clostridia bacterium]
MQMKNIFSDYGLTLSCEQQKQFEVFTEMLIEKNKVMNLTAITEPDEIIIKHYLDSALPAATDYLKEKLSVIDVGCGAGFPSIPLKIMLPQLDFTLLDSLNKRLNFINEVISELGLENIRTVHSRAEDGGQDKKFREKFDVCVARAVAPLNVLCELCTPFVKKGGIFIAMKGKDGENEIAAAEKALKILNLEICEVIHKNLPNGDDRNIIIIRKKSQTPPQYPRKAPKPSKSPL